MSCFHRILLGVLAILVPAKLEGYLIEGHVPEREVRRLLDERPEALGLVVPGMPVGSPGMGSGSKRESPTMFFY